MKSWFQAITCHFLPSTLKEQIGPGTGSANTFKTASAISVLLISLLIIVFTLTYEFVSERFSPESRSMNLPNPVFVTILWGWASGIAYYHFDVKKAVYVLLPGIICGGGMFLGIISFATELIYPNIILQANTSLLVTLLTIHMLNSSGVLERYPNLENILIFVGSCLMYSTMIYISYLMEVRLFTSLSGFWSNPLGPDFTILFASLVGISLMSIVGLFHLNVMRHLASKKLTLEQKVHLGANSLFIIFFLYLSFLALFAFLRGRKRSR